MISLDEVALKLFKWFKFCKTQYLLRRFKNIRGYPLVNIFYTVLTINEKMVSIIYFYKPVNTLHKDLMYQFN